MTQEEREPPVEKVIERIEKTEAELAEAREAEKRAQERERAAERKLNEEIRELEEIEKRPHSYDLTVNRRQYTWPREEITGAEIKTLAGSPSDWVVNQIVDGPGEDPEVQDTQIVHLAKQAEPKGEKRFTTRKPKTSPGA
jgi:hypothetical protein